MSEHRPSSEAIGKKRTRAVLASYMAASLVVGCVVSSNVIGLVLVFQVRDTQTEGSPMLQAISDQQDEIERAANAAEAASEQLADCVDPEGKCFKATKSRDADNIASINEIVLLASFCADQVGEQSVVEIQQCVITKLAKRQDQP